MLPPSQAEHRALIRPIPPAQLVAALVQGLRALPVPRMVDRRLLAAARRMLGLHRIWALAHRAVAIRGLLLGAAPLVLVRLRALLAAVPPLPILAISKHQATKA